MTDSTIYYVTTGALNTPQKLPISESKYKNLSTAAHLLGEAFYLEQKYDFVVENYIEFEEAIHDSALRHLATNDRDFEWFYIDRALHDRRIMNLLTTTKSYADAVKQHLNRIFPDDSSIVDVLMKNYSEQYDSRIGYRAISKLRNYVQHEGVPVHGSNYSSGWLPKDDQQKSRKRTTVDPFLSTVELRKGGFNRTVLEELEASGDKPDLKLLIRDYIEGLSIAHGAIRSGINQKVMMAKDQITEVMNLYSATVGVGHMFAGLYAVKKEQANDDDERFYFNLNIENHRCYLVRKNHPLISLSKSYVSGEVVNR